MGRYPLISKERLIRWLPLLLSFFLGGILGGAVVWISGSDWIDFGSSSSEVSEVRQGGYRFTNPLLECETVKDISGSKELRPFKYKVQELVDAKLNTKKADHISVYFRDLNNGPWFGIDEKKEFSPASLLKVPILMVYLKLAEFNPQLLTKKIKYEWGEDFNLLEDIRPSKAIEKGKTYTVDELLYMMIAYSDNNAKDLLLQNIDARVFNQPYIDLGIEVPGIRKPEDFMNVKTYASFFRVLFNASYLNREMSEKALEYLTNVEFKDGLVAGVPSNVVVAHKFGERRILDANDVKQLHDCGIIYYPGRPYLLCVMTRGNDFGALIDNVRDISYLVYEEIDRQYRNK